MSAFDFSDDEEEDARVLALEAVIPHLKKLVENEGYIFSSHANVTGRVNESSSEYDLRAVFRKEVVWFFGKMELELMDIKSAPNLQPAQTGALYKLDDEGKALWLVVFGVAEMTKQRVVNWLKGINNCIVCFADKNDVQENIGVAKMALCPCLCGATMCFGCVLDQITVGVDDADVGEMQFRCPNCRQIPNKAIGSIQLFCSVLLDSPSLRGLSDTQLALLKKYTGFDGSKKAMDAVRRMQEWVSERQHIIAAEMKQNKSEMSVTEFNSKLDEIAFSEVKRELENGSGDISSFASSAAVMRARNGCGNCGKQFWDVKAKKLAPKCAICKRVPYCNAKCRKAHKKKHAPLCKKQSKRKPANKRAKRPLSSKTGEKQSAAKSCCKPY